MSEAADDDTVARATAHYPPADLTPTEFESFVVEVLQAANSKVDKLEVRLHERVDGVDGSFDFDATVRYELAGMNFLVLVEAKHHKYPIKRELVQVLYQKLQSVGAHKAIMMSTAPYQRGALEFAKVHGIALVTVTEGRFTYETKAITPHPAPSREKAMEWFGLPPFVGHSYAGDPENVNVTTVTVVTTEYPDLVAEALLGVPIRT